MSFHTAKPNRSDSYRPRHVEKVTPDAIWTKIHGTIISANVLDKAGMAYRVFPDFTAVLGKLSRPEIAELTRQTYEARQRRKSSKTPVDGHRIKAGEPSGMMDRASNASDSLQHHSTGCPRSGARHSSVKKEHEHNHRPRPNSSDEERRCSQSKRNEKNDDGQINKSNISRPLAQPALTAPAGKYADKTDKKLPIKPILKKEGTSRVRFGPGVQINTLHGETSTRKRHENAPVGHISYSKQKEGSYRQYEQSMSFKQEGSYNRTCKDGKCESVACRCFWERSWDRDGVRQSAERRLTSSRNYHGFGRTDGKYTSPKHEIEVFVTGRTTDYRIQIVVEYKDLTKHMRRYTVLYSTVGLLHRFKRNQVTKPTRSISILLPTGLVCCGLGGGGFAVRRPSVQSKDVGTGAG
ncbi:uncharacterized protein PpBr36_10449 [Pyricularia pennisetigena]|uniref:uncharacterized protein n=1 Tax=Pyricularia pennisetigena TaxID=1578925 RepID=UPI00114FDD60|nr:uncharacterized protein PpBr36_10428 [Pyricularia pennisetigena]XP_029744137.1 uncharacterized protein PpBr36_10449 [Pyricularia pennisetigena]TLS21080.1 hypothetical protein PpBr36_10428 [Pyricularia pennisetigena]TLS21287.1 hypothetical protein PpBr36_10449 [Pyricularia pennisetigena]